MKPVMVSRHDTKPTLLKLAIRKAIADFNVRTKLYQLDLYDLTDLLFDKIWYRHDFGPWSKTWVWLDGKMGTPAISGETDTTLAFTSLYYVRGNRKLGYSVPIRLELKIENDKLNYILKVDRVGSDRDLIDSRKGDIVYALGLGEYLGEWIWKYEVTGSFELSK